MIPYNENGTSNTSDLGDGIIARQKVVTVSRGMDGAQCHQRSGGHFATNANIELHLYSGHH